MQVIGSRQRTATSKFKVSYWCIPGGADYDRAYLSEQFFEDRDSADKFAEKYAMPPEMAVVIPLAD